MYTTTELQSLLDLLAGSEQSGTLTLQSDTQPPAWQVRLTLVKGQPIACVVMASQTAPVEMVPTQALAILHTQGTLQWNLEQSVPEQAQSPQDRSGPPGTFMPLLLPQGQSRSMVGFAQTWRPTDRPCRIRTGFPPTEEWERLQRSTFGLVDDRRTVQEIARILHKSCEDIASVLQELHRSGWIGKR